jgi:putative Holliday junction resolvase
MVGIDFGTKRVGIAMTDPLHLFAQPMGTYSPDRAIEALRRLAVDYGLSHIVVGWPLTPEGEEGRATERVQEYINRLKNAFRGVPVSRYDERFSSRRATAALVEAGVRRRARGKKERIDAAAAAVILQDFLDEGAWESTETER